MSYAGFTRVMDQWVWLPQNDGQPIHLTRGDAGGSTAWGCCFRFWAAWQAERTGVIPTIGQFSAMHRDDFLPYYEAEYWKPIMGDILPVGADLMVMDVAVMSGVGTAAKLLRKALGLFDGDAITEHVARSVPTGRGLPGFFTEFAIAHDAYDRGLKDDALFGNGWHRRTMAAKSMAYGWYQKNVGLVSSAAK